MALTITTIHKPRSIGNRYLGVSTLAFDSSYAVGGESLTPADLGFATGVDDFHVEIHGKSGFSFEYDYTNHKVLVRAPIKKWTVTYDAASLAAVTARDDTLTVTGLASTDLVVGWQPPAAFTAGVVIDGVRISATDTAIVRLNNPSAGAVDAASGTLTIYTVAANGAAQEVADTTDLSGLTGVRVAAYGREIA